MNFLLYFSLICFFTTDSTQSYKPRYSTLEIFYIEDGHRDALLQSKNRIESPNWSPDGSFLVYNKDGNLYRYNLKSNNSTQIPSSFAKQCTANHCITPNGKGIIFTNKDPLRKIAYSTGGTSRIYFLPIQGGEPRLITAKAASMSPGISPNGRIIAFSGSREGEYDIFISHITGGEEIRLTSTRGLDDGPEYSPDGKYIYFNSFRTGSMEIWRMDTNGENPIALTDDSYANWFPHPSPDGKYLLFMSYLEEEGYEHPKGKDIILRLLDLKTNKIDILCRIIGGEGTFNGPCWAPDSKKFAFVSYE